MVSKKLEKVLEKGRNHFFDFCKIVTREDGYEFADFHKFICDSIDKQLVEEKRGMREMFSVPPGYGKSTILSQLLPAYLMGKYPSYMILLISYSSSLSIDNAQKCKKIMEKPIYKLMFPDTVVVGQNTKPPFKTSKDGVIRGLGRGGTITGRRANFILIDDILSGPEEAGSPTVIDKLHHWFPTVAKSRILPGGGIIILSTRWTKKDLIGHLHEKTTRWNYVNLECVCEHPDEDPLGRAYGEVLWPAYYTEEMVMETREESERDFQVVYQGNCTAAENTSIDVDQIQYVAECPFDRGYSVISYDTASKTSRRADYTAICEWRVSRDLKQAYLVNITREKMEFPELLDTYDNLEKTLRPNLILIEDANSGTQLLQMRADEHVVKSRVFKDLEEKSSLGDVVNLLITDGNVTFNERLKLKTEIIKEIDEFPFGSHDDVPLSMLHFFRWFIDADAAEAIVKRGSTANFQQINKMLDRLASKKERRRRKNLPFRRAMY